MEYILPFRLGGFRSIEDGELAVCLVVNIVGLVSDVLHSECWSLC